MAISMFSLVATFYKLINKMLLYFSAQIKITVSGFFNLDQDIPAFKEHLRDFLVQIRVSIYFHAF